MHYGHFDDKAREYVITRPDTPRPWSNYLGSTEYGAIITNHAGGYSFYKSGATGRFLRMRFNSVPLDQPGRLFYLRDQENGDFWSTSWQPVGKPLDKYKSTCRHGMGYTIIESRYASITTEATYFVPLGQTFEYWRLRVTNKSKRERKLSLFTYCEFANLWSTFQDLVNLQYSQFITRATLEDGILGITCNPNFDFDGQDLTSCNRTWMALSGTPLAGVETTRERFCGPYGGYAAPDAVVKGRCSNFLGEGDNIVGGQQADLTLAPGETKEVFVLLGLGTVKSHGWKTVAEFGNPARCEEEFRKLKASWHAPLKNLQVETPDANFDAMINTWNAYNALITYSWSRSASLVYNGERDGLGFRDTVQDILGATPLLKDGVQSRLELMLTGQLANGGAIPVIKPFSHQPGKEPPPPDHEYRSDDCLWFFNTIPAYVAETGDIDFYSKVLPYADRGEATVLGHLRRALEFNLERTGRNGLPCGLAADWNDCIRLGYHGESVFVAFQVRYGLDVYAGIAEKLVQPGEADWARAELAKLDEKIQKTCWDGEWFIWAIGQDGTIYGTKNFPEGQVYMNTQAWAILSGAATPAQTKQALATMREKLATPYGLMLCAPPFIKANPEIMKATLFNAGIKENAGIFSHTQSWAVMAECLQGNGDQAYAYYRAFMPSAYNDRAEIRQVEPYVHCQTTYSRYNVNEGASRVPWLSGTASWAYYSATHWILGIRPEVDGLRIAPCIPKNWPGFKMRRNFRGRLITIEVQNPHGVSSGVRSLTLDGKPLEGDLVPAGRIKPNSKIVAILG
ncbi:GH36-type glycosyl hydrolase domain-containing protein [Opitutus terrae]|uniref:Glycosyltransferase 36 n=1 Tax=Opitutus terrae (strain DSM 11246 / JCM 15787 / PB90-1) TaxID=452637 RepID=B1ZQI3_OPITP|nr:glycosyl hydrolase family 65 protein [Opitutus terrae]ACB75592.1 glycosyltransferase 36 [Opitutus terrae PB90-1]